MMKFVVDAAAVLQNFNRLCDRSLAYIVQKNWTVEMIEVKNNNNKLNNKQNKQTIERTNEQMNEHKKRQQIKWSYELKTKWKK